MSARHPIGSAATGVALMLATAIAALATMTTAAHAAAAARLALDPFPEPSLAAIHDDPRDTAGPLDLTEVVLEQHDVRMALRITTAGAWTSTELTELPGRALCVTLHHGQPITGSGRICVTRRSGRPALDYAPLARDGSTQPRRPLAARITMPRPEVLQATFLPAAAGMSVGPFSWSVHSDWRDQADCRTPCSDRLPDQGELTGSLALLGGPPCFGAAARDPRRPCENVALRGTAQPQPERARYILDSYCNAIERVQLLTICEFGAEAGRAARSFVLIGDSHAASLKTALTVATLGERWRGYSILRAACPATLAPKVNVGTRQRSRECVQWNRQALRWLAKRSSIDTAFLSAHVRAKVGRVAGKSMFASVQAGYRGEIQALLRRVRRVVVIRDTPSSAPNHLRCVARALNAGRSPGPACARPRRVAVRPDPLVAAARSLRSPRVQVIDLTRHFCSARVCFPVVGGVLVHRDATHLTPAFSATLGPFILRALER
ncbi:MAG: SGNH hydrolase domain-containing protein [Solirubrobacteraceae bacterium]|nr:SGNH hydrolase domain-containing protein [Solirubrobacteraceae bacterium]